MPRELETFVENEKKGKAEKLKVHEPSEAFPCFASKINRAISFKSN